MRPLALLFQIVIILLRRALYGNCFIKRKDNNKYCPKCAVHLQVFCKLRFMKSIILKFSFALAVVAASVNVSSAKPANGPDWLSDAVFYQLYPSSYKDSDGDGKGDLKGIIDKLDYIKSIGVNVVWINPVFVSGWTDGGYDVIDYYKVDPRFGTNSDLVALFEAAHARGMRVVLDLVAGHTSIESPWFKQSSEADPNLQYSHYYIWPDFKPESDNSWEYSKFVESDAPRAKYYVKNFYDTQPALNFGYADPDPEHPWEEAVDDAGPMAVRRELQEIMRFWICHGCDGFRVDMAHSLVKDDPDKKATMALWEELSAWYHSEFPECVLIAEWFNPTQSVNSGFDIDFFAHDGVYNYSSLFFNINRLTGKQVDTCYFDADGKGQLRTWYELYYPHYEATAGKGYTSVPTSNHDCQRPAAGDRLDKEQLKVAMTFFLTMPGAPFIYYGDEIGMRFITGLESVEGSNTRAGSRTPMQWDSTPNAGFSTAPADEIYIPIDPDVNRPTVEGNEADQGSLLNYVRDLLELRSGSAALGNDGGWEMVSDIDEPYPMVYRRYSGDEQYLVVINPSGKRVGVESPGYASYDVEPVFGSYKSVSCKKGRISISGISAAVLRVSAN